MTCYCGATDCPSCGPAQGYAVPARRSARAALRDSEEGADIAMQRRADEDAEPAEFLDGCLPRNR